MESTPSGPPADVFVDASVLFAAARYPTMCDRRHLLSQAEAIDSGFDIAVATPDAILTALRLN